MRISAFKFPEPQRKSQLQSMSKETSCIPLEFWYSPNASLALPWLIMPDPATGEMTFYNAMHGTSAPLRQVLEQEDQEVAVRSLDGAKL